jgi:hypothetical protein
VKYPNIPYLSSKLAQSRTIGIGFLVALSLIGPRRARCEEFVLSTPPDNFHFYQYQDGRVVAEQMVRPGHPTYDTLLSLLRAHRSGWVIDVNTYTPSLYLKSDNMNVNCRDDSVVINFVDKGSGRWRQLSNPLQGCKTALLKSMRPAAPKLGS